MIAQRPGVVSVTTASGLVLALIAADRVAPTWVRGLGLDAWSITTAREEAVASNERAATLEADLTRVRRENEASDHRARRLIAGSITLAEAAAELEPIVRDRPGFQVVWSCVSDPPPTPRHAAARCIIARVEVELRNDPARHAAISDSLWAEYAAMK